MTQMATSKSIGIFTGHLVLRAKRTFSLAGGKTLI
jgi:hypothetical protein